MHEEPTAISQTGKCSIKNKR